MKPVDLRRLDILLLCDICDGEVDLPEDDSDSAHCRHCGIAFWIDAPMADQRRRA